MKDVDSTRRPFQAQGITLAMLCRRLAAKLNTIAESADTIENFNSLEAYVLLLRAETKSLLIWTPLPGHSMTLLSR